MECVFCGGATKVVSTRRAKNGKPYRRRICLECNERFTTHEVSEAVLLNVLSEVLPERLVDEISHNLSSTMQKLKKRKKEGY